MLKISKLADYGVVLLTTMAAQQSHRETFNARDLAEMTQLPLPMVSKVLKALAREDLLQSQRGVKGGYSLAKPADEITAVDIISALDGPIALTSSVATSDDPNGCGIIGCCDLKSFWQLANNAIVESLNKVTLAQLLNPGARGIFADGPQVSSEEHSRTYKKQTEEQRDSIL